MTPEQAVERLGSMPELQPGTAPKITPEDIEAQIFGEHYFTAADGVNGASGYMPIAHGPLHLLTFCVLVLRNGFTVTGESACASPENFDAKVGRDVARKAAVSKCWSLLGYELRTKLAGGPVNKQPDAA